MAVAGVEPFATRLKAAPDKTIRIFTPDYMNIVVAGGETQGAWKMIGRRLAKTVSVDPWRRRVLSRHRRLPPVAK
ncbi:MAG: hypothetical protein ACREFD_19630 [Stellaceae bacterium]